MSETTQKKGGVILRRVLKVIAAIVALLAVIQVCILGYFGIGPLGFVYKIRMSDLPGNRAEYDFAQIVPMENSPLAGKHIAILGSSVAYGEASEGYAVGEYLCARLGCELTKETVSGTTLVAGKGNSYVSRLHDLDPKGSSTCSSASCPPTTRLWASLWAKFPTA